MVPNLRRVHAQLLLSRSSLHLMSSAGPDLRGRGGVTHHNRAPPYKTVHFFIGRSSELPTKEISRNFV